MNADRDKSEQPVDLLAALQRSIDAAKAFRRDSEAVSQRLADAGTPPSAPEPSQAATEAHGDDERVDALHSKIVMLRQALWDTWVALGHDTDGDTGPGALIAGMGDNGFVRMVIGDATKWRRESEADYDADTERLERRAEAAEAKVSRVEALVGNWESTKGAPESEAWTHYVAERVRNALSGDYSSEAETTDGGDD